MRIRRATITVQDVGAAAAFYSEVLCLPVDLRPGRAVVTAGRSELVLERGAAFEGVHHLAFGIAPADFQAAHRWLADRVDLHAAEGFEVIVGPDGWDSRSLYFSGPEDVLLELIARDADRAAPASPGPAPRALSISEVGIAVPDVPAAVAASSSSSGCPVSRRRRSSLRPSGTTTACSSSSTRTACGSRPRPTAPLRLGSPSSSTVPSRPGST